MKVGFPYIAFDGRLSANRGQLDISLEIALLAEDHLAVGTVARKVTKQQNARSQRTRPITLVGTAMRKGILAKTVPCRKIGARSSARTVVKVSLTSYGFAVIQSLMLWTVGHGKGRCTNPPVESGDGGFGSGGGWDNAGGFDNPGGFNTAPALGGDGSEWQNAGAETGAVDSAWATAPAETTVGGSSDTW